SRQKFQNRSEVAGQIQLYVFRRVDDDAAMKFASPSGGLRSPLSVLRAPAITQEKLIRELRSRQPSAQRGIIFAGQEAATPQLKEDKIDKLGLTDVYVVTYYDATDAK